MDPDIPQRDSSDLDKNDSIISELHSCVTGDDWGEDIPRYLAVLSISGMTCITCVGHVEEALRGQPSVENVRVSLVTHSADIHFRTEDSETRMVETFIEAVEDHGYDASLIEVKSLIPADENAGRDTTSRTVSLHIEGMRCDRCPQRVMDVVADLDVQVLQEVSTKSPILTISYLPDAPRFTIRQIIHVIEKSDASFSVEIYKPVSVEQRSHEVLSKERRGVLLRVALSVCTAIPTFIIGIVYMNLVSHDDPGYKYLMMDPVSGVSRAEWAMFVLATVVYLFATDHFHKRTLKELWALWKPRSPVPLKRRFFRFGSMNMLISLGTTVAYFSSIAEMIIAATTTSDDTIESSGQSYFDSVVFLTLFLLIGRLAEAYMKVKTGDAISALGNLRPTEANLVLPDGDDDWTRAKQVSVDLIDVGDTIRIPHGATPPSDGTLLGEENASFNESSLTGESRVVTKSPGDTIYTGTINQGSSITIRVEKPPGLSMLDSIIQVVREGQSKRAPMERAADLLTAYFVPVVVAIAIITWILWLTLGLSGALPDSYLDNKIGGWGFWSLQFAIAVFVIACPCGLGLAAPTALFVGGGMAAQRGILVKGGGEAFQEASNMDAVVFDKTGTLTQGSEPVVMEHRIYSSPSLDGPSVLNVLGKIEEHSSHPLAQAIIKFSCSKSSGDRGIQFELVSTEELAGKGLTATLRLPNHEGLAEALVGNENLMNEHDLQFPPDATEFLEIWKSTGYSVVLMAHRVSEAFHLDAIFALADPLRPEAADVVKALYARKIDVWMLTGDNHKTARVVGSLVGIRPDRIIADVLPTQKAQMVKYLQQSVEPRHRRGFHSITNKRKRAIVAMVGDGINDAPALAAADVGIAVASSSDVAIQSAGFVLLQQDLHSVLALASLSRAVFRRVILNFFWAAFYNIIALPIAAGVLYPIVSNGSHVRLDPVWAALAMALSSITVLLSSLLLRTRIPGVGYRE